jgi:GGDEF domain-containing protein
MREHLQEYRYSQHVSPELFAHQTDWLLRWQGRDQAVPNVFSLLLFDFLSPEKLGDALGAPYAMQLIEQVDHRLGEALRSTDLLCRTHVSRFWVLLPHGAPGTVLGKLEPILSQARAEGLNATHLRIATLTLPKDLNGETSASELFDRLASHRD